MFFLSKDSVITGLLLGLYLVLVEQCIIITQENKQPYNIVSYLTLSYLAA